MTVSRRFAPRLLVSVLLFAVFFVSFSVAQVTPPEEFLGFEVGADFKLITYEQAAGYIELLDIVWQESEVCRHQLRREFGESRAPQGGRP